MLYRHRVLCSDIHIAHIRADGVGRDFHGFNHAVGIALQNASVHERTRVALIGVAAHIFLYLAPVSAGKLPLSSRGESGAAAAAETTGQDLFDNAVRRHFRQGLIKGRIAVSCDIFVDILRIDHTAVAERNPNLFFIERGVLETPGRIPDRRLIIEKTGNPVSLQQMLGDNLRHILRVNMAVYCGIRENGYVRTCALDAEIRIVDDLYFLRQAGQADLQDEFIRYLSGCLRRRARAGGNQYIGSVHCNLLTRNSRHASVS